MDVLRLIGYDHALWRRFADHFEKELTWEDLSTNHETSHNTIANVVMHALNMEDWWLHYVLQKKEWSGPAWDGARSVADVVQRMREVPDKTDKLVAGWSPEDLTRRVTLDAGDGPFETTLEDLLVEIVNESTHHRGEVMAMMWRIDKAPPYVSFLDWEG